MKWTSLFLVVALFERKLLPSTQACSCAGIPTLDSSFAGSDVVLRAKIVKLWSNVDFVLKYIAKVDRVYKGCDVKNETKLIISTANNSALCGVTLRNNTFYLLMGQYADAVVSGSQTLQNVRVDMCRFRERWNRVSNAQRKKLNQLQAKLPSCPTSRENCTTSECDMGPVPSAPLCPGGVIPNLKCTYDNASKSCRYVLDPCPRIPCTKTSDCAVDEYCSTDGSCHLDGTCSTLQDCFNPNNEYFVIQCLGNIQCSNGYCSKTCGPVCPASAPLRVCPNPCNAVRCAGPCVNYKCGTCQPFCFTN